MKLRVPPLFLADKNEDISKYDVVQFMCNKTVETPLFMGIPPDLLMILELEGLKMKLNSQITKKVNGM